MTAYEEEILQTGNFYDLVMQQIESESKEIFTSYVTGDDLHEKISNPLVEGIDEG